MHMTSNSDVTNITIKRNKHHYEQTSL